jgi:hypothetical protein
MKFRHKSISPNDVRHHQAGLTLLELIISISLMMLVSVGMVQLADRYSDDVKTAVIADQLKRTGDAARAYIKDNYATIAATATTSSPYQITAAMLTAGGYLPTSSVSRNGYGQDVCTLVLQPSANKLQAMVVTEGGTTVDDLTLGDIVKLTGSSSGAILSSAPTVISGAMGGWSIPVATWHNKVNNLGKLCDGTTAGNVQVTIGHPALALWFEDGSYQSNALYRDAVPGQPQLNTMNTPLVMASVQTSGGACTTSGAIAQDGAGGIVSCQSGIWTAPGDGKCVSTSSDLNVLQTDGRCYNGNNLPNSPAGAEWVFVEVFRHTNPVNYYVAQRVIGMTGAAVGKVWIRNQQSGTQTGGWSAWVQTADPGVSIASGNVTAAGTVTGGRIQSTGGSGGGAGQTAYDVAGNMIAANTSIYSYNKICTGNSSGDCNGSGGVVLSSNGSVNASSNIAGQNFTASQADVNGTGFIRPGWAVETWGCSAAGDIAKAAYNVADGWAWNGKTLTCQSGVWRAPSLGESNFPQNLTISPGQILIFPSGSKRIDGELFVQWTGNNAGVGNFEVLNGSGSVLTTIRAGINGWNDGGSGSQWWFPVSIPIPSGAASVRLVRTSGSNAMSWTVRSISQ